MCPTAEGTIRSVWGPCPLVPNYGEGYPNFPGRLHGIHHAVRWDGKEILLIQWGDGIHAFRGWAAAGGDPDLVWHPLLGPASLSPVITTAFEVDSRPRFPPQFESTPGGVVIVPKGESSRPFFYDGTTVAPLGFDQVPGAPIGWGPDSDNSPNDSGYHHDGANMHHDYRYGRLGTVTTEGLVVGSAQESQGTLMRGSYRAVLQWIDLWGNLSAQSPRSNSVVFEEEKTIDIVSSPTTATQDLPKQVVWAGLDDGPDGTIGKILGRTKDERHSGTLDLFEMPSGAQEGGLGFATIPDNASTTFPDNVPDAWLVKPMQDVVPVRPFKLYKLAFGRGFAANYDDDPGLLRWTKAGQWGTFLRNDFLYPDPRGAAITGMQPVPGGLLVFTESSTFLVEASDDGQSFRSQTIHTTVGCSAPSSIATMPTGETVWLGREGFYVHAEGTIGLISSDIDREVRTFNKVRLLQAVAAIDSRTKRYRCWVAVEGSIYNNRCWEYDGQGWSRREDIQAADVTVTDDHRHYMLAVGRATDNNPTTSEGVWVVDHQVFSWIPKTRTSLIETAWLRAMRAEKRGSPLTLYFWLRESESGTLNVDVYRDWRTSPITQTLTVQLYPTDDAPPFWDTTTYGQTTADGTDITWKRRRPYWIRGKADIFVAGAETFKLRLSHTGHWDFVGLSFDEVPHKSSFRTPK